MAFLFLDINFRGISLIVSLDGKDLITSTTAVTATLNNIGPGLGLVGRWELC